MSPSTDVLTHFDAQGQAHMVDVGGKSSTRRIAVATGRIEMLPATLALANRVAAFICGQRGPLPADAHALSPWRDALHALPAPALPSSGR